MNPLERAARALYMLDPEKGDRFTRDYTKPGAIPVHSHFDVNWKDAPPARRARHEREARAVLLAIREPSGEMLGDVHDTLLYHVSGNELDTARIVWDRFVGALLSETS